MNKTWIQIDSRDNVAVALVPLQPGHDSFAQELKQVIPQGHKFALQAIALGGSVIKYGHPIGTASSAIQCGEHVHTHNLKTGLRESQSYAYQPEFPDLGHARLGHDTFLGYPRPDGRVGTRNEIWIINTVGCVNKTAERLAHQAGQRFGASCEGIYTFVHPYGCSQLAEDHETTKSILLNLVRHPNAGGVLVLGLGCENNTIDGFTRDLGEFDPSRVKFLVTQEVEDELEEGLKLLEEIAREVRKDQREPCSISKLVIGLKCGGSDGLSGITANPLLGRFTNRLIQSGGSAILTEVPEMFGAESILMNRCQSEETYQKTVLMIEDFKGYFVRHGQEVFENPSPGNKEGGISTLEEKSLGCIQKGGWAPVVDVIPYAGRVRAQGLTLLNGPGNDIVSTTALSAAGANLILFTTGRGTPLGAPVPTVKISSNSDLAKRKKNWIDFNAGTIVEGVQIQQVCDEFCEAIVAFASGKLTRNELNGYREIAIFKDGVTL